MTSANPSAVSAPRRSLTVTLLAWGIILFCLSLLPISFLAQIMILGDGHGSASADLSGWFIIVAAPVLGLVAGIGLLRRNRVALLTVRIMLVAAAGFFIWSLFQKEKPPVVYYAASGVKTTQFSSGSMVSPGMALAAVALCGVLLVKLWSGRVRAEFAGAEERAPAGRSRGMVSPPAAPVRAG